MSIQTLFATSNISFERENRVQTLICIWSLMSIIYAPIYQAGLKFLLLCSVFL